MGATPSMAREYPWCSRTSATGFNPSCTFISYNQCMATVSGQRGDCMQNPMLAYGDQRRGQSRAMRGPAGRLGQWMEQRLEQQLGSALVAS